MKLSRWRMIWGLKLQLFETLTFHIIILMGIYLVINYRDKQDAFIISVLILAGWLVIYSLHFGFVIDIIFKNIGETGWVQGENVVFLNPIPGFGGNYCGCEIKVLEEGSKHKRLDVYKNLAPWPEVKGNISEYKIYYLKICKAVVGWEVIVSEDGKK